MVCLLLLRLKEVGSGSSSGSGLIFLLPTAFWFKFWFRFWFDSSSSNRLKEEVGSGSGSRQAPARNTRGLDVFKSLSLSPIFKSLSLSPIFKPRVSLSQSMMSISWILAARWLSD